MKRPDRTEFGISDLPTADLLRIAETCDTVADEVLHATDDVDKADDLLLAAKIVREYAGPVMPAGPLRATGVKIFGIPVVELDSMPEGEFRVGSFDRGRV